MISEVTGYLTDLLMSCLPHDSMKRLTQVLRIMHQIVKQSNRKLIKGDCALTGLLALINQKIASLFY